MSNSAPKRIPQWVVAIVVSLAFAVLFGIGIVASSLIFQPERIVNEPFGFWLSVILKTITQVIAFNLAYFIFIISKKTDALSDLRVAFQAYANYVQCVYKHNLQQLVRAQIKIENRNRFIDTSDTILETITESLHYKDLFKTDPDTKVSTPIDIDELVKERAKTYSLTKKQAKVLRIKIIHIINGRVSYQKVDYNELMINAEKVKKGYVSMSVSEGAMILTKNASMIVMAFALAVITTIFIMGEINGNILYEILSSLLTILFAILSAIIYGTIVVNKLKRAYSARRDFFNSFIKLKDYEKNGEQDS
jgi:hypothetical protein